MLISSRALGRRCPVCGAANCSCGGPSNVRAVECTEAAEMGGKLVRVPLGRPGLSMQITEAEARRLGYLPAEPEPKARPVPRTKMRRPAQNKGRAEE